MLDPNTPVIVCVPVNVFAASVRAIDADVDGNVIVVPSVPMSVIEFDAVSVFPDATESVPPPLSVQDAPSVSVFAPLLTPVPPFAAASVPDTPVDSANPVAFVSVIAEGVPRFGVVNAGDVASTIPPLPVTFCPSAVTTPVPAPVRPVDTGNPVALVSVRAVGVPRFGVVSVGEVARTIPPEPVTV